MADKKKRAYSLEKKNAMMGYVYMTPLIFGLLVLFIPNMVSTIRFTFFDIELGATGGLNLRFAGLDNYITALTNDIRFKTYLAETIGTLIAQIPVIVIFSLFIAVVLNQRFRGRVVFRTIFFLPVLLATGILLTATTSLPNATADTANTGAVVAGSQDLLGNLTAMLSSFGLGESLINIVVSAANGIYDVVISSGIQIFIFLATLQEVPSSLYEAAKVEGCDGWQSFWKITFPAITPAIVICLIYTAIDTFTKSGSSLDTYINDQTANGRYEYGITMSLLFFLCIALIIAVVALIVRLLVFGRRKRG